MNNTTKFLSLDEKGICNYCYSHEELNKQFPINGYEKKIARKIISDGKNKKFDCISNPVAGQNIKKIVKKTNFDLRTITSDWRESKDIKIALLKASVPDMQLGTDLGIASALYSLASKENVKYILSGVSFRTEGVVPLDWNYLDGKYLKSIMREFGSISLRKWKPEDAGFNFDTKEFFYYSFIKGIKFIPLLYHVNYVRSQVEEIIKREFDWVYPGAHYMDDLFQSLMTYVLRVKFKIEFRRFNYSALIRSGQLNRLEALEKMKKIYSSEDEKVIDLCINRLGLDKKFIEDIMNLKPKSFLNYKTNYNLIKVLKYPIKIFCKMGILPPSLYLKFFT